MSLVRNPKPAEGGIDPETATEVRAYAPAAFRTQERAVTEADYAEVTERHPGVQRATATFRWTGSWYTVFITVDRIGGLPVDADFEESIRQHVERYRMAGHDLEVDGPRYVSLEIEMHVCAEPNYFREDVKGVARTIQQPCAARWTAWPFSSRSIHVWTNGLLESIDRRRPGDARRDVGARSRYFNGKAHRTTSRCSSGKLELGGWRSLAAITTRTFAERGVFQLRWEVASERSLVRIQRGPMIAVVAPGNRRRRRRRC